MSREFKNSGIEWIGEIPKEWKTCIGKLLYLSNDGGVWGEDPTGSDDTIVLRSTEQNIDGQLVIIDPAKRHLSKTEIENATLKEGDLIITKSSGSPSHIGKTSIIDREVALMNCCFSNFIQRIRVDGIAKYYWYNFNSPVIKDQFSFLSTTTTGINNINAKTIDLLMFPLPSLPEQQKIADYLDKVCGEVDEMITLQEQMIEELKAYKQSVITEAVTKGLNPNVPMKDSGIDWIGEIPENWKVIRIKYLLKERKERSDTGLEEPLSMSQKYGLIPTKEMDAIPNIASSFVGAKLVYRHDLVFNKLKAHLGVFAESDYDGLVSPDYAVYYSSGLVDVKYLEYLFKSPQYIAEFIKLSTGVGAGLTRLYTSDLYSIYGIVPPIEIQREIVDYIRQLSSEINTLIAIKQTKIEELKDYKKSVIYEYVTGKKEVV